jgi:hypothetical protein
MKTLTKEMYNIYSSNRKKVTNQSQYSEDYFEYKYRLFIDTSNRLVLETKTTKNGLSHNQTTSVIDDDGIRVIPKVFDKLEYISGVSTSCVVLKYIDDFIFLMGPDKPHDGANDLNI